MKTSLSSMTRLVPAAVLLVALAGCCGLRGKAPRPDPQQSVFKSPEDAAQALLQAVKKNDTNALLGVFGESGREIVISGDDAADAATRKVVAAKADEHLSVLTEGDRKYVAIGNENWRLPVPLVSGGAGWFFDSAAGKDELLTRRIGRNELNAIKVCQAIISAQQEFAAEDRDGDGLLEFADRLCSDPGKTNGLFWAGLDGNPRGTVGPLLAAAEAAGHSPGMPYHGYVYKILVAQGKSAPGGKKNYVAGDNMTGGFALLAYPVNYEVTGVMTFIVGDMGIVYEKNLGKHTSEKALKISEFNPDDTWAPVMDD